MSYTALYRKYRPAYFSEVRGQDAIVTTLRNQIRADRIGHAYLFSGTRGTGKTTIAKIMARAVNCENPADGEPCGECASCRAILAGRSLNVIEIDAASNNGVDNIRAILDEVEYPPSEGRYKVYIIDEVHMLSAGAYNALLKTLEEPPSYVIFILATTEVHKIPVTILSRCQRYSFRRIGTAEICARLDQLLREENVEADEDAVKYIARKADGAMRDALSLADQCISFYLGQKLTYERVLDVLGAVDTDVISALLRMLLSGDVGGGLKMLSDLAAEGLDLDVLVSDFTEYLRSILLYKASEVSAQMLDLSPEQLEVLKEDAALVRDDILMRYIHSFSELAGQMRYAYNKRVLLEIAMIRLCRPQMRSDELSVIQRVRRLEEIAERGALSAAADQNRTAGTGFPGDPAYGAARQTLPADGFAQTGGSGTARTGGNGTAPAGGTGTGAGMDGGAHAPAKSLYEVKAAPEDLQQIEAMWSGIISGVSSPRFGSVLATTVRMFDPTEPDSNLLVVAFKDFLGEPYVGDPKSAQELERLIGEKLGKEIRVKLILRSDVGLYNEQLSPVEVRSRDLAQHIAMDIETEDD